MGVDNDAAGRRVGIKGDVGEILKLHLLSLFIIVFNERI